MNLKPETPHDEAVAVLTARGFYAKRKDHDIASRIIVSRGTRGVGLLATLDGVVYLLLQDGKWDLEVPLTTPGGYIVEHGYPITAACERAIKYLQSPEQVWQAYKLATKQNNCPALEYWYPDCLPLETAH